MSFASMRKAAEAVKGASAAREAVAGPYLNRNVALRVQGYNVEKNSCFGVNLLTGVVEEISLRPYEKSSGHSRAEVREWAGQGKGGIKHKAYTEVGGVIVFDQVYEGTAKWGKPYAHTQSQANVAIDYMRPFTSNRGNHGVEIVWTTRARKVASIEELRSAIIDAMKPSSFSYALIRTKSRTDDGAWEISYCRDDSGRDTSTAELISRARLIDKVFTGIPAEEAADDFLSNTRDGRLLSEWVGKDMVTEVIPVQKIYAGKDTQEVLGDAAKFQRFHNLNGETGYTPSIIATRTHEVGGGTLFTAQPLPTVTRPLILKREDIPTQHIAPLPSVEPLPINVVCQQRLPKQKNTEGIASTPTRVEEQIQSTPKKAISSAAKSFGRRLA